MYFQNTMSNMEKYPPEMLEAAMKFWLTQHPPQNPMGHPSQSSVNVQSQPSPVESAKEKQKTVNSGASSSDVIDLSGKEPKDDKRILVIKKKTSSSTPSKDEAPKRDQDRLDKSKRGQDANEEANRHRTHSSSHPRGERSSSRSERGHHSSHSRSDKGDSSDKSRKGQDTSGSRKGSDKVDGAPVKASSNESAPVDTLPLDITTVIQAEIEEMVSKEREEKAAKVAREEALVQRQKKEMAARERIEKEKMEGGRKMEESKEMKEAVKQVKPSSQQQGERSKEQIEKAKTPVEPLSRGESVQAPDANRVLSQEPDAKKTESSQLADGAVQEMQTDREVPAPVDDISQKVSKRTPSSLGSSPILSAVSSENENAGNIKSEDAQMRPGSSVSGSKVFWPELGMVTNTAPPGSQTPIPVQPAASQMPVPYINNVICNEFVAAQKETNTYLKALVPAVERMAKVMEDQYELKKRQYDQELQPAPISESSRRGSQSRSNDDCSRSRDDTRRRSQDDDTRQRSQDDDTRRRSQDDDSRRRSQDDDTDWKEDTYHGHRQGYGRGCRLDRSGSRWDDVTAGGRRW